MIPILKYGANGVTSQVLAQLIEELLPLRNSVANANMTENMNICMTENYRISRLILQFITLNLVALKNDFVNHHLTELLKTLQLHPWLGC